MNNCDPVLVIAILFLLAMGTSVAHYTIALRSNLQDINEQIQSLSSELTHERRLLSVVVDRLLPGQYRYEINKSETSRSQKDSHDY